MHWTRTVNCTKTVDLKTGFVKIINLMTSDSNAKA